MKQHERWLFLVGLSGAGAFWAYACGGSRSKAESPGTDQRPAGLSKDDQSRCDFQGRVDREVKETSGPGAAKPNIRRVYGLVGEGANRRRVLVCREVDTNLDGTKDVVRTYDDKGEKKNEFADSDYDGRIDTWIAFTGGRISEVKIDSNRDGQPDQTRMYVGGRLTRVERDTNHDARPDVWEVYQDGQLQRMGVDLDFDGRVDRWNRDEVAAREQVEREEREEEAQRREEEERRQEPKDGGVTDARVSARNR
jgi:hypothetical protein